VKNRGGGANGQLEDAIDAIVKSARTGKIGDARSSSLGRARGAHPHRRDQRSGGLARVLEQDQHRAGAALRRRCLAEGEHRVAQRQPFAQLALEDGSRPGEPSPCRERSARSGCARRAAPQKARDAERASMRFMP